MTVFFFFHLLLPLPAWVLSILPLFLSPPIFILSPDALLLFLPTLLLPLALSISVCITLPELLPSVFIHSVWKAQILFKYFVQFDAFSNKLLKQLTSFLDPPYFQYSDASYGQHSQWICPLYLVSLISWPSPLASQNQHNHLCLVSSGATLVKITTKSWRDTWNNSLKKCFQLHCTLLLLHKCTFCGYFFYCGTDTDTVLSQIFILRKTSIVPKDVTSFSNCNSHTWGFDRHQLNNVVKSSDGVWKCSILLENNYAQSIL